MNREVVTAALDSIGRDTQTARLVAAKDYAGALKWLQTTIRPGSWGSGQVAGGVLGEKQRKANEPRADAYVALEKELDQHVNTEGKATP